MCLLSLAHLPLPLCHRTSTNCLAPGPSESRVYDLSAHNLWIEILV